VLTSAAALALPRGVRAPEIIAEDAPAPLVAGAEA
jgi:hypothetical protein